MLSETREINSLRFKVFCPLKDKTCFPKGEWPVLCFLHGNGEHGGKLTIEQALKRHGPLKKDDATREAVGERFIVVFPQLPDPGGNVWVDYADDVGEIMKVVWNEYGGDRTRTYLTGFSFGGNGVFRIASKKTGVWAALWPVDPKLKTIPRPQLPVCISLGEYSRSETTNIKILGYQDIKETVDNSIKFVYFDYGEDHVPTATAAYRDKMVYDWLLDKRLGGK